MRGDVYSHKYQYESEFLGHNDDAEGYSFDFADEKMCCTFEISAFLLSFVNNLPVSKIWMEKLGVT